jgi:hypothetical protein
MAGVRRALLPCLAACGFQGPTAIDAAGLASGVSCLVGTASSIGSDRGKVGLSAAGASVRPLACDGDARLVGLALDMSNKHVLTQSTGSARGIRIGCAAVTVDASNGHTGLVTTKDIEGTGDAGWSPSTMTELAVCPPGAVVSGLQVHSGSSGILFVDATMTCSVFAVTGQLTITTSVPIAGSQSEPLNPSQAQCSAGEHVVSMTTNTGFGLDSVRLFCAPTICK